MFFINIFGKILKVLRSNQTPAQIAGGFVLGMLMGITPFWSLVNLLLLLVVIIINVNLSAVILAYMVFSAVVYLADPMFHSFGYWLLVDAGFLKPLWISMYHAPLLPYTRFNNTVYLGSFIVGLLLSIPVYIGVKSFVINYRQKYEARVNNWKWVKWIKASKLYTWYERLKFLGE